MNWSGLVKSAQRTIISNSPAILTAIGAVGTITTALLATRATTKYMGQLAEEGYWDRDYKFERTPKEHFQEAWKLYIPAASSAIFTVAAIICANRISSRRAAALAIAYSLSEQAFEEYRTKIAEKLGEKKERAVRDEIAQEHVQQRLADRGNLIYVGTGDVLCYDDYTGRPFSSSMEKLRRAENEINHQIIHDHYASLSDLYDKIGIPQTGISDQLGWNLDHMLELDISGTITEDGKPCLSVSYKVCPALDRFRCL